MPPCSHIARLRLSYRSRRDRRRFRSTARGGAARMQSAERRLPTALQPSNDRNWSPDQAMLPSAENSRRRPASHGPQHSLLRLSHARRLHRAPLRQDVRPDEAEDGRLPPRAVSGNAGTRAHDAQLRLRRQRVSRRERRDSQRERRNVQPAARRRSTSTRSCTCSATSAT